MKYTNINITNNTGYKFNYAIGLEKNSAVINGEVTFSDISVDSPELIMRGFGSNILRDKNTFFNYSQENTDPDNIYTVPGLSSFKICDLCIFWPEDSADRADKTKYYLEVAIHICDVKIVLGSYILNRVDNALAINDGYKLAFGTNFYEYTKLKILDPWSMIYDDEWDEFRKRVCNETPESNNESAQIMYTLIPIVESNDKKYYVQTVGYNGATNSMNISDANNYLRMWFDTNIGTPDYDGTPKIICKLDYNPIYGDDFIQYLQETYNIDDPHVKYEVAVIQNRQITYVLRNEILTPLHFISDFMTEPTWELDITFKDWTEYADNLQIMGMLRIYNGTPTEENEYDDYSLFEIRAAALPITQDVFRFLTINNNDHRIYNINDTNMTNYPVTILNKTVQNVIKYDRVNDSKSNIVQPMFFKAYDLEHIIIHPAVTENICINLDIYKSKVKTFRLKIENTSFVEHARTNSGVLFQIQGKKLSGNVSSGTYYILDDDGVLVTSGKYDYEM